MWPCYCNVLIRKSEKNHLFKKKYQRHFHTSIETAKFVFAKWSKYSQPHAEVHDSIDFVIGNKILNLALQLSILPIELQSHYSTCNNLCFQNEICFMKKSNRNFQFIIEDEQCCPASAASGDFYWRTFVLLTILWILVFVHCPFTSERVQG